MSTRIDNFFYSKGIKTYFNTLGCSCALIELYVNEYKHIVNSKKNTRSENFKPIIYRSMYDLADRQKLTGFEYYTGLDKNFRNKITPYVKSAQFSPTHVVDNSQNIVITATYKQELKNTLKSIDNILLYLSGGLDSELVASALIDINKKFDVVIFEYVDNIGNITNKDDIIYAKQFCKKNNIKPNIFQINIENLWQTVEFQQLAIDVGVISPQLTTYAYMIELMSKKFPNSTHMFGGEVRFYTNHLKDDNSYANLVFLDKVSPGYTGQTYSAYDDGGGFGATATSTLVYLQAGTWEVVLSNNGTGSPLFGTWTTTPGSTYEFRISAITNDAGFYFPSTAPTGWTTIAGTTEICTVNAASGGGSGSSTSQATFTIEVRVVGQPTPASSTITLIATAFN